MCQTLVDTWIHNGEEKSVGADGEETKRLPGESEDDFLLRHELAVDEALAACPPDNGS